VSDTFIKKLILIPAARELHLSYHNAVLQEILQTQEC